MASSYRAAQGEMWDQVSLAKYGGEKSMGELLPANVAEMDALFFQGETSLEIPQIAPKIARSLPPWERF